MKHPILMKLSLYGWRTGLLLAAASTALVMVFGTSGDVKSAVADSGAYTTIADSLAQTAIDRTATITEIPLAQDDISQAAHETFSADAMRRTAETAIDSTYGWLQGKTPTPDIRISTSSFTDTFANNLTSKVAQRTGSDADGPDTRPACTLAQLQQIVGSVQVVGGDTSQLDTSKLACSPAGAVNSLIGSTIKDKAQQTSNSELEKALRSNTLPLDTADSTTSSQAKDVVVDNQAVANRLSYVPTVYHWAMLGPWLSVGLAALSAIAIILITRNSGIREGVRRMARSLLVVGIILAVLAALSRLITVLLSKPDGTISHFVGSGYGHVFVSFVGALERKLDMVLFIFGIVYIALAAMLLIYLRWQSRVIEDAAPRSAVLSTSAKSSDSPTE